MFLKSEKTEESRVINGVLSFQVSSVFFLLGEASLIKSYNRVSSVLHLTPFHDLPNFTKNFGWVQALSHKTILSLFSTANHFGS